MLVSNKTEAEIADRIEGALEIVAALDGMPFSIKREAAEMAARAAVTFLRHRSLPDAP